jgi:cobalamin biosynthesis Co2+ chelatase CbiK
MDSELIELCSKVSNELKQTAEYQSYQTLSQSIQSNYANELKKLDSLVNSKPRDYQAIKECKEFLESKEDYLKYLQAKRIWDKLLTGTLKEIMDSIDPHIVIKGIK